MISHVKVIILFSFLIDESSEFKEALLRLRFEIIFFSKNHFLIFNFSFRLQIAVSLMNTGHRFSKNN